MAEQFVLNFIEKLVLLEIKAGAQIPYRPAPPIAVTDTSPVYLQSVGRQIAQSIGLSQFIFDIAFATQDAGVVGHIDLTQGERFVHIELEQAAKPYPYTIAAILCHEIAHKWLQVRGISASLKIDNEILTDITTVFLGYGKTMLNGCLSQRVQTEYSTFRKKTITQAQHCGYLKQDQFAFVYCMVCAMRGVPRSEYEVGLNADALKAVRQCEASYGQYFSPRYHRPDALSVSLHQFQTDCHDRQVQLAQLTRQIQFIRQSFCDTVTDFIASQHRSVNALQRAAETLANSEEYDPVLRFLLSIVKEHNIEELSCTIEDESATMNKLRLDTADISKVISRRPSNYPAPTGEAFRIITCPIDGTRLRLPLNVANLRVTCPTCRYQFAFDTTGLQQGAHTSPQCPTSSRPQEKKWTVFRFWNLRAGRADRK